MIEAGERVGTVVLTALELEYDAVRALLTDLRTRAHPAGTLFETGTVRGTSVRIALAVVGPGNRAAAVLVERATVLFRPAALLFVGVAGALHTDIALGDVVVATHVYGYHGGRQEAAAFLVRPRAWQASHRLEQSARHLARTATWTRLLPDAGAASPISVHFRPVVAGDVLLDSRTGPVMDLIRRHYNDAAAIEMESAGAAEAAHLNSALPLLTVRGISDRADGTKLAADKAGTQRVAASHAAAFAVGLAVEMAVELAAGLAVGLADDTAADPAVAPKTGPTPAPPPGAASGPDPAGVRVKPVHHTIVAIDAPGSGGGYDVRQLRMRADLRAILAGTLAAQSLDLDALHQSDLGNGIRLIVPASVSPNALLDPFVPNLAAALRRHRQAVSEGVRLRLRVAVHMGLLHRDAHGWAGTALTACARLLDAPPVRRVMAAADGADLVLVVSDTVYDGLVRHGYGLDPASFHRVPVAEPGPVSGVWLHVPGFGSPPGLGEQPRPGGH